MNAMRRLRLAILPAGIAIVGLGATMVSAQERMAGAASSASLRALDARLTAIERTFGRIQSARTDTERDKIAPLFEKQQYAYSMNVFDQYSAALGNADRFVKSNGESGGFAELAYFEILILRHEGALKALTAQSQRLAPKGEELPKTSARPMPRPAKVGLMDRIVSFLIPQAKAAIALQVSSVCNAKPYNQTACAQAIARGIVDGNAARAAFSTCWASYENRRPKWWRAVLRASCTAALVARLA